MSHLIDKNKVSDAYKNSLHGITNNVVLMPGVSKEDELLQLSALSAATNMINNVFPVHLSKVANLCIMNANMYQNIKENKELRVAGAYNILSSDIIVKNSTYLDTIQTFIHEYGHSLYTNVLELNDPELNNLLDNIVFKLTHSFVNSKRDLIEKFTILHSDNILDYYSQPTELFARAFVTYTSSQQDINPSKIISSRSANPHEKDMAMVADDIHEMLDFLKERLSDLELNNSPAYNENLTQEEKNLLAIYEYKLHSDSFYSIDDSKTNNTIRQAHRDVANNYNGDLFNSLHVSRGYKELEFKTSPRNNLKNIENVSEGFLAMSENYLSAEVKTLNKEIKELEDKHGMCALLKSVKSKQYSGESQEYIDSMLESHNSDIEKITYQKARLQEKVQSCKDFISEIQAHDKYNNIECRVLREAYTYCSNVKNKIIYPDKYDEMFDMVTENESFILNHISDGNYDIGLHCESENPSYATEKLVVTSLIEELSKGEDVDEINEVLESKNLDINKLKEKQYKIAKNIIQKERALKDKYSKIVDNCVDNIKDGTYVKQTDKEIDTELEM